MSTPTTLYQLRMAAARAQGYAADVAGAAASAIEEVAGAKADKARTLAVALPATGWTQESAEAEGEETEGLESSRYPCYYDITAQVTANDRADVIIETASLYNAAQCGFCPTVETLAGAIRVRAQQAPQNTIQAKCWIMEGATS